MFACVPMPTLRAMLSKNLPPQQYGKFPTAQKQKLDREETIVAGHIWKSLRMCFI